MSRHTHRRRRETAIPRTLPTIVGIAALVTAALGATALGRDQQVAAVSQPLDAAEQHQSVHPQHAHATRRAQVVRASRSYTRTSRTDSRAARLRAARHTARLREKRLSRLTAAADARGDEIQQQRERARRLERQRERERQRELARQHRIERMNAWVAPVSGYEITATFGAGGSLWSSDHTGLDFAAAEGSPVGSTAAGEVTSTGYDGSYGNQVVVTHDDGTETWYCHLSSISVRTGQSVGPGTTVGAVGMTGNTTGPHLHLEVRPGGGSPVDPYAYLQSQGAL